MNNSQEETKKDVMQEQHASGHHSRRIRKYSMHMIPRHTKKTVFEIHLQMCTAEEEASFYDSGKNVVKAVRGTDCTSLYLMSVQNTVADVLRSAWHSKQSVLCTAFASAQPCIQQVEMLRIRSA